MKQLIKLTSLLLWSWTVHAELAGDWEGVLEVNGMQLPLVLHLQQNDGVASGTLDSPAQGAMGMPMSRVEMDGARLLFELSAIGVHYEGQLDEANDTITGKFIQGGVFDLSFSRADANVAHSDSSDPAVLVGQWGGTVQIPGNPLSLVLHVKQSEGQLQASADSPDQNVTGLVVDAIGIEAGEVRFTMQALGVEFTGHLSEDEQTIDGDFKQQGLVFKLALTQGALPKQVYQRPQQPQAPFAYHVEDVVVENVTAGVQLAGTLTRPQDPQQVKAAAVMITGSGPQDRNETVFKHEPFWVIADHLAAQGYAVLRMDDRGVGDSTGDFKTATSADFVTDISAAVDYLQTRDDIPADKVGLIGHSEGGMIAPMLAAERDDLGFLILLAGPGIPITELLAEQKYLIAKTMGQDETTLQQQRADDLAFHQQLVKWAKRDDYSAQVSQYLKDDLAADGVSAEQLQLAVDNHLKMVDTPWFRYFIAFDPAPYLAQVSTPLLALNGELDVQVAAESNLAGIERSLQAAQHPDFTIQALPQLNHLFQTSTTGATSEYVQIEETFAPAALQAMVNWLNKRYD
ncbi:alpha/beta hydrolase family protein [Marinicella meishanensis]|uniref:alpha/beta hydrolase family protein n=1 Tax=Marinicella meishanensis TaxID=2873263 RepID=UPI001CBC7868|nr:alpha/beta fold hydrolase [Marinicella sp. NBU2979]